MIHEKFCDRLPNLYMTYQHWHLYTDLYMHSFVNLFSVYLNFIDFPLNFLGKRKKSYLAGSGIWVQRKRRDWKLLRMEWMLAIPMNTTSQLG